MSDPAVDGAIEVSNNFLFTNEYTDKFNEKTASRSADSWDELRKLTPDECNLAFEDDISLVFLTSVLEILDDVLSFFTFGISGFFINMRESYAHSTLSSLSSALSYLDCYVPNSLVYNPET